VFLCILPGKVVPEMTYTMSGGKVNPTHSLTAMFGDLAITQKYKVHQNASF